MSAERPGMQAIVVVGGGGHAKVIISILKKLNAYEIVGYTDMAEKGNILTVPYLGNDSILAELFSEKNCTNAVLGIGSVTLSTLRIKIANSLESINYRTPAILSPHAVVNEDVVIGKGTVVFDGAIINSGSRVGQYAILNTNCSVDHDCVIDDYVHVAPGATLSGGVKIGRNSIIGAGTSIVHNVSIGENCLIGAGSTVTRNIAEPGTYAGNPVKKIK